MSYGSEKLAISFRLNFILLNKKIFYYIYRAFCPLFEHPASLSRVTNRITTSLSFLTNYAKAFKQPSSDELAHDFLWRYHKQSPAIGSIGNVFYQYALTTHLTLLK